MFSKIPVDILLLPLAVLALLAILAIILWTTTPSACPITKNKSVVDAAINFILDQAQELVEECGRINCWQETDESGAQQSRAPPELVADLGALIGYLLRMPKTLEAKVGPCWLPAKQGGMLNGKTGVKEYFHEEIGNKLQPFLTLLYEVLPKNQCMECFGGPLPIDLSKDKLRLDLLEPGCLTGNGHRCGGGSARNILSSTPHPTLPSTPLADQVQFEHQPRYPLPPTDKSNDKEEAKAANLHLKTTPTKAMTEGEIMKTHEKIAAVIVRESTVPLSELLKAIAEGEVGTKHQSPGDKAVRVERRNKREAGIKQRSLN